MLTLGVHDAGDREDVVCRLARYKDGQWTIGDAGAGCRSGDRADKKGESESCHHAIYLDVVGRS